MQFMIYGTEQGAMSSMPTPEQMAEVMAFTQEAIAAGILVATGGLQPNGTRIRLVHGTTTVTDAPMIEAKELIAGFAVIQVESKEAAIEWAMRFRSLIGEGESELVQILGPA